LTKLHLFGWNLAYEIIGALPLFLKKIGIFVLDGGLKGDMVKYKELKITFIAV